MPVEILVPVGIVSTNWSGFPFGGTNQYRNVDETMAAIDTTDYNHDIITGQIIKYRAGKLTNVGVMNSIKMAINLKRLRTQGIAGLRIDVYLAGLQVVPSVDLNIDSFLGYAAVQETWLANEFLAPWVGLTGQQWNDEIDLDPDAAQYWHTTLSFGPGGGDKEPDPYHPPSG